MYKESKIVNRNYICVSLGNGGIKVPVRTGT